MICVIFFHFRLPAAHQKDSSLVESTIHHFNLLSIFVGNQVFRESLALIRCIWGTNLVRATLVNIRAQLHLFVIVVGM